MSDLNDVLHDIKEGVHDIQQGHTAEGLHDVYEGLGDALRYDLGPLTHPLISRWQVSG